MVANAVPSPSDEAKRHQQEEQSVRELINKLNGSCFHVEDSHEISLLHQGSSGSRVWAVGDDLILKRLPPKGFGSHTAEIEAQNLIACHPDLHIPAPKVLHTEIYDDGSADIVMKRLAGVPLTTVWNKLSRWDKYSIAKEVGGFIAEWRRVLPPADGVKLASGEGPPELPLILLRNEMPAMSGTGYTDVYDLFCPRNRAKDDEDDIDLLMESMPDFGTCMFTHNNLDIDNILVHNRSVSGILGFKHAWYWPEWFEILSLEIYADANQKVDQEWKELLLLHMPREQNPAQVTAWYFFWKQLRRPREQREQPVVDILRKLLKTMQIEDMKYDYKYSEEHSPGEGIHDENCCSDDSCAEGCFSDEMSIDGGVLKRDTEK